MHYNSYGWERGKRSSESLDTNHNSHNVIKSLCFPVFHIGYLVNSMEYPLKMANGRLQAKRDA